MRCARIQRLTLIQFALSPFLWQKIEPFNYMKKEPNKSAEIQLLNLLKKILPKTTTDAKLADKIYDAIASELKSEARADAFQKFCTRMEIPDLEKKSIDEIKLQLAGSFRDGDVTLKPGKEGKSVLVEVDLPDGTQLTSEIRVNPNAKLDAEAGEEQEIVLKFVPFPVCLPGDKELVWMLAKRENMTPEEAGIALAKIEEEFWASKTGQKLIRDRTERSFPEFISRAPAGMLTELGLKRHYKTPEPVKLLRPALNAHK